jgi:hypothetical protein
MWAGANENEVRRNSTSLSCILRDGSPRTWSRLALQLHFHLDMNFSSVGLMGAPPSRPCDVVGGLNLPLCETIGDAADFLDRPPDQL